MIAALHMTVDLVRQVRPQTKAQATIHQVLEHTEITIIRRVLIRMALVIARVAN